VDLADFRKLSAMRDEYSSTLSSQIRLACVLEATARKPGNVHPGASFDDLCYADFVRSADAVAPVLARARELGVGQAVLESVRRTRDAAGRNTNLGIVLLLAPLAGVEESQALTAGVPRVLEKLTREDAVLVYSAIRLAQPGGMGEVPEQDLSQEPTETLVEIMRLAAGRDAIAAQYARGFDLVLNAGVPELERRWTESRDWERAVIGLHLWLMARQPDTLIVRKCGMADAQESARRAREVLDAGWPESAAGQRSFEKFDRWLREQGNRRNPGTTADLVTACLFAALREKRIAIPEEFRVARTV
jgi:triphosphoribosyl-dephospho-CoA synthase